MMESKDRTNYVESLKEEHIRCINMHGILVKEALESQRNRTGDTGLATLRVYAMQERIANLEAEGRNEGVDLRCNYRSGYII